MLISSYILVPLQRPKSCVTFLCICVMLHNVLLTNCHGFNAMFCLGILMGGVILCNGRRTDDAGLGLENCGGGVHPPPRGKYPESHTNIGGNGTSYVCGGGRDPPPGRWWPEFSEHK